MKVKTGLRVPGRVRKERPTYRIDMAVVNAWLPVGKGGQKFGEHRDAIYETMPLIRCTMPTPCQVCWYCKQREKQ